MFCKSCGDSLKAGAKFCGKCGTVVETAEAEGVQCPKCGTINRSSAKFCLKDGTPLIEAIVTAQEHWAAPPAAERVASQPAPAARSVTEEPPSAVPVSRRQSMQADAEQVLRANNMSHLWLAIGGLAVLVTAGGGYWFFKSRTASRQVVETTQDPITQAPATSAAPEPERDVLKESPAAAKSEAPPLVQSQVANAPQVSVGDRWVTEVVDHQDAKLNYRAERIVTEVAPDRIFTAVRTLGKDYVRFVEYTSEWALVATHLRSGATTTYAPEIPYLSFPLQKDKSWEARVLETDAEGQQRVHAVSARVDAWESVHVPAGTFAAVKIVLNDEISKDGVVIQRGQDVSWYAPEARRTVKTEETSFDPATRERRRRTVSLVEYALQPPRSVVGAAATESTAKMAQLSSDAVSEQTCVACRGAGIAGAPRFGGKAAWDALIAQDMDVLYTHARKERQGKSGYMPSRGGRSDLIDQSVIPTVGVILTVGR